jgi:molybdenum cofactor cytidylyltransferase
VIAAVVLAAGRSTRMGTPKLLLTLSGRSVLRRVVDHALASRCEEIVVVVGEAADRLTEEVRTPRVRVVVNDRYREGMGTSLAVGVSALPPECDAAVVLLGDQPCVTAEVIDTLIDAYRKTGKPIVASRYGEVTGAPTLIAAALFDEARRLGGDIGGRFLIQRHPDLVEEVQMPPAAAVDVDTPEEFARLRAALEEEAASPGSA